MLAGPATQPPGSAPRSALAVLGRELSVPFLLLLPVLAEAMIAVVFSATWHAAWWEWRRGIRSLIHAANGAGRGGDSGRKHRNKSWS